MDKIFGFGNEFGGNQKAEEEHEILSGHHDEDLFDQPENSAGEIHDLATGKAFDNTHLEANDEHAEEVAEHGSRDVLPDLPTIETKADKATEDWLRANDPDYGK